MGAVKDTAEYKDTSPEKLAAHIIIGAMLSYSQQNKGILASERKQYYKITDELGKALDENKSEFPVNEQDFGFLRKIFREVKLVPNGLLKQIEDQILISI